MGSTTKNKSFVVFKITLVWAT